MNYEKKYKEALERAKEVLNNEDVERTTMEYLSPELKESEDERIREELKHYLEVIRCQTHSDEEYINCNHFLAWLEKQGEQKSVDGGKHLIPQKGEYYVCIKDYCPVASNYSVNTKGKIYKSTHNGYINNDKGFGLSWTNSCTENYFRPVKDEDWIVCEQNNVVGEPLQYKDFKNNEVNQTAIKMLENNGFVPNLRLWTIEDAKDGDVLATDGMVFIFNIIHGIWLNCHCSIHKDGSVITSPYDLLTNKYFNEVYPATKEQRDKLEKAMHEAGYTFDFDKVEDVKDETAWAPAD